MYYDFYANNSTDVTNILTHPVSLTVAIVLTILSIVAMWKVFEKAGKAGWKSIIPFYNIVVLFQIIGINPWLALLYLVPIVNIVLHIVVCGRLAQSFKKGIGFAIGLFFFEFIFTLILGFGSAKYVGAPKK